MYQLLPLPVFPPRPSSQLSHQDILFALSLHISDALTTYTQPSSLTHSKTSPRAFEEINIEIDTRETEIERQRDRDRETETEETETERQRGHESYLWRREEQLRRGWLWGE